ncbi:MAG: hypothetical protein ACREEB_08315 [Caulobacteraceae bacterium]
MRPLSPYEAAGEGFRLMRREPRAVIAWAVLWFATFSVAAWTVAAGKPVAQVGGGDSATLGGIAARFGPFWAFLIALFLLVWLITAVAAFRAVLRPAERRWFYLRLGDDELRLGLLTLVAFLVAIPLGGAPAYLVFVLASPLMRALPAATRDIAGIGAIATVWLDIWLGARLSLIAVETFSERRFHLTAYWPVTRGRFWYLLACYFLFFLVLMGLTVIFAPIVGLLSNAADIGPGGVVERGRLLIQAGVLAALISLFWTLSSTLFYACQAHAFRAIVGEGRDGVAPT